MAFILNDYIDEYIRGAEEDDKYGRTKGLNSSLKNMPEVVHENAILADVIESIRFLEEKKGSDKGD